MNFELFVGRFHPVFVHLPIGIIVLAAVLELIQRFFWKEHSSIHKVISLTLFLSFFTALMSVVSGLSLAQENSYPDASLAYHKYGGIAIVIISLACWILKSSWIKSPSSLSSYSILALFLAVMITGHLGGNLTHGDQYLLENAPTFVQNLFGVSGSKESSEIPDEPDSILVYQHLIVPVLGNKCYSCHGSSKINGGLALHTKKGILEGGDGGPIIDQNDPQSSTLLNRITLPHNHQKFMPPQGTPVSYTDTEIIEFWISKGADFEMRLSEHEVDEQLFHLLKRDYSIDLSPKPIYEVLQAPILSKASLEKIKSKGFSIDALSESSSLYEVSFVGTLANQDLQVLLEAKDQITWLNLSNCDIDDRALRVLGELKNLTRLQVQNNPVTDAGLRSLSDLQYLESLNIYNTKVSDASIPVFLDLENLKRLYVWRSEVTTKGIQEMRNIRPDLIVQSNVNE